MVICAPEFLHADLHEFLTAAYQFYDIIIWSATRLEPGRMMCNCSCEIR